MNVAQRAVRTRITQAKNEIKIVHPIKSKQTKN